MTTTTPDQVTGRYLQPYRLDVGSVFSGLRAAVGVLSWASPTAAGHLFGLGSVGIDPRVGVVTRLFGVRELALSVAIKNPDPVVRRRALQAGVVIDSIDVVASLIALGRGAPKITLVTFTTGAALFAGLGMVALAGPPVDEGLDTHPVTAT